jgi:hypothetical protein
MPAPPRSKRLLIDEIAAARMKPRPRSQERRSTFDACFRALDANRCGAPHVLGERGSSPNVLGSALLGSLSTEAFENVAFYCVGLVSHPAGAHAHEEYG